MTSTRIQPKYKATKVDVRANFEEVKPLLKHDFNSEDLGDFLNRLLINGVVKVAHANAVTPVHFCDIPDADCCPPVPDLDPQSQNCGLFPPDNYLTGTDRIDICIWYANRVGFRKFGIGIVRTPDRFEVWELATPLVGGVLRAELREQFLG